MGAACPNTAVDVFSTAHSVLLLEDLLYVLAFVLSSKIEFCTSNTDGKLENILCFKTRVDGKKHVEKTNPPPKQKPQPSSQKTWSHQEFLFMLGKYYMTSGTHWMTCLSCKSGMCSFHSWEWELQEPRHCLLCCFWEESSVVDLTRNHDEDIRVHYAPQSFSIFFFSAPWAVPFSFSLFPFCHQLFSLYFFCFLSPTVSLKYSRKAGLPQSVRWWTSDKAVPVGKFASTSR